MIDTIPQPRLLLVRAVDFDVSGDGRTIEGEAFKWAHPDLVTDDGRTRYLEEFAARSVTRTLAHRGERPVFVHHQHLLGSVGEVNFYPSADALVFKARATDSRYASQTMERVRSGDLPSVSLGFYPRASARRSDPRGIVTTRTEISIEELSLTKEPQHSSAAILAVRSEIGDGTPLLDAVRRRRAALRPL